MTKITRKKLIEELTDLKLESLWLDNGVTASTLVDIYTYGYSLKGWSNQTDEELIASAKDELGEDYVPEEDLDDEGELYKLIRLAEVEIESHNMLQDSKS